MGRRQCCVCLEPAVKPVRLPCRCQSIMCLDCFRRFINEYSNCLICREKIVSRLRRLCAGRDYECLVDETLAVDSAVGTPSPAAQRPRVQEPEPGELRRELARINARFEQERLEEERASLELLEELKRNGDADVVALERLRADEELARSLQESATGGGVDKSMPFRFQSGGIDKSMPIRLQRGATLTITLSDALASVRSELESAGNPTVDSSGTNVSLAQRLPARSGADYATPSSLAGEMGEGLKSSSSDRQPHGLDDSVARKRVWVPSRKVVDARNSAGTGYTNHAAAKRAKTWTCSACTYAETSASWLHCDMCGASKHPSAAAQQASLNQMS